MSGHFGVMGEDERQVLHQILLLVGLLADAGEDVDDELVDSAGEAAFVVGQFFEDQENLVDEVDEFEQFPLLPSEPEHIEAFFVLVDAVGNPLQLQGLFAAADIALGFGVIRI